MSRSPMPDRAPLERRLVDGRTALLIGLCVVAGCTLSFMVIGSEAPAAGIAQAGPVATEPASSPSTLAPESADPTLPSGSAPETAVEPPLVDEGGRAPLAESPPAVSPDQADVGDASPGVIPAVPAPTTPITPAQPPVVTTPRAAVPSAVPAVAATTAPPTTAAATTPTSPTTSTTSTPPGATARYPSYAISGVAQVVLRSEGSSISVASVSPQANWVYQIDHNGPRSVEVKFFNVVTEREAEFHAELEGSRIKVESGGG